MLLNENICGVEYGKKQNASPQLGLVNTTTGEEKLLNEHNEANEQRALAKALKPCRMKTLFLKLNTCGNFTR